MLRADRGKYYLGGEVGGILSYLGGGGIWFSDRDKQLSNTIKRLFPWTKMSYKRKCMVDKHTFFIKLHIGRC
jgi:hypothetical protein